MNFITRGRKIGLIISAVWLPLAAFGAEEQPVSYGRQIAPLFAFHCAGCHGASNPSSNLRLTRYSSLRAGGDIGDEIVPGHPEKSVLMDFIEGKRGPQQRMPQNSNPLPPREIAAFREWIVEGARNDGARGPCFDLSIRRVRFVEGEPVQIRARITVPAFLIISLSDPVSRRELFAEEASVNFPREAGNLAEPGEWISRTLTRQADWPASVSLKLRMQYASAVPSGSVLIAGAKGEDQRTSKLLRSVCNPL